jgi:leukotriene-A4 hydrolase
MTQPVPSYLIALAAGNIEFVSTGPRTGVYAEKSMVKRAAKEFADTEAMIQANERMFGPYRWSRYDVLVMPSSFPVGGMENPRLSFITPVVVAGDKSLVSVIAHELAHSWAGNLVGNATWRDVWLNEGFTNYMESRIMTAVYGEQRAGMEQVLALKELNADLKKLPPGDQMLANDLRDRDPEDAFTAVPYDKGRLFLNYLDAKFGRERFDAFLKTYFDHFAFKAITTDQFVAYLQDNLLNKYPGIVSREQVNAWVFNPGLPADAVLPVTTLFATVDEARAAWLAGSLPLKKLGTDWNVQQWLYFLENMPPNLSAAQMTDLDKAYGFTKSENAEVASSWFKLVIAHDYQPAYPRMEEYLNTIGRTKLIKPLYEGLMNTGPGQAVAKRVFAKAKVGYHPETVTTLEAVVEPDKNKDDDDKIIK